MVPRCSRCDQPAVKRCMGYSEFPNEWVSFCYVHAAEAGLIDLPRRQLRDLNKRTGYPENAIAFVLEALLCAAAVETADDVAEVVMRNGADRRENDIPDESCWNYPLLSTRPKPDVNSFRRGLGTRSRAPLRKLPSPSDLRRGSCEPGGHRPPHTGEPRGS